MYVVSPYPLKLQIHFSNAKSPRKLSSILSAHFGVFINFQFFPNVFFLLLFGSPTPTVYDEKRNSSITKNKKNKTHKNKRKQFSPVQIQLDQLLFLRLSFAAGKVTSAAFSLEVSSLNGSLVY